MTEISTATICACLPTLRPAVNRFAPGILGSQNTRLSQRYKNYFSSGRNQGSGGAREPKRDPESGMGAGAGVGTSGSSDRASNSASSQRGVLHTEELALRRAEAAAGGAGAGAGGGDDYVEEDESERLSGRFLGFGKTGGDFSTEMAHALDSAEQLGLKASVRTEIGVATPPPEARWGGFPNRNRGIAVQRDVVLTESTNEWYD